MQLTTKQENVLTFLRKYLADHGVPPTAAEVQAHFGYSSQTAAIAHLRALERKGKITRKPYVPRSIAIL